MDQVTLSLESGSKRVWSLREAFVRTLSKPQEHSRKHSFQLGPVTLKAKAGDRIAIVGPNGSGKTTFCRLLCGLYRPDSGVIKVDGDLLPILDPDIGHFPDLPAIDNVSLALDLLWPKCEEQKPQLIEQIFEFAELKEHQDKPIRAYSLGMRTRLALATFSIDSKDILVIDEGLDGIDSGFRSKWSKKFEEILDKTDIVFLVSHDLDKFKNWCTSVLAVNKGQFQHFASWEEFELTRSAQ